MDSIADTCLHRPLLDPAIYQTRPLYVPGSLCSLFPASRIDIPFLISFQLLSGKFRCSPSSIDAAKPNQPRYARQKGRKIHHLFEQQSGLVSERESRNDRDAISTDEVGKSFWLFGAKVRRQSAVTRIEKRRTDRSS